MEMLLLRIVRFPLFSIITACKGKGALQDKHPPKALDETDGCGGFVQWKSHGNENSKNMNNVKECKQQKSMQEVWRDGFLWVANKQIKQISFKQQKIIKQTVGGVWKDVNEC
eukprot:scaffold3978_cov199-Amphora_coffeaeformis.AAC.3